MHWLMTKHDELQKQINLQSRILEHLNHGVTRMTASLDRLTAEVADTKTAVDGVLDMVKNLQTQLNSSSDDSAALDALSDQLDSIKSDIAAVTTPATPEPTAQ